MPDSVPSQAGDDSVGQQAMVSASEAGPPAAKRGMQRIPVRVREAIRHREERAEIQIGWAQLAIVILFTVLYSLAPRAGGSLGDQIEPVPLFLSVYGLFTLLRLSLAYQRMAPAWFLHLSSAFDMALLMGLIWSFHIQYGQHPAFYLKAPTQAYVFIFIALRALRFDPQYVISAGLSAAVGWFLMVIYAVSHDPGDGKEILTRNYVEYITMNRVLIGAEFDKIMSILVVTGVLGLAIWTARRLLITAVREEEAAKDLQRFFAPEVAAAITTADDRVATSHSEAREVAVMFVDIRNFTRFAAGIHESDVARLLAGYRSFIVDAVKRNGGTIDKFLGDGIMATFGAVTRSDTYAADGVRAMLAVLEAADRWNDYRAREGFHQALRVNAGLAAGRAICGPVGDQDHLEYTVVGDTVNLAAKLEGHNKMEGSRALTTAATLALAETQGFEASPGVFKSCQGRAIEGIGQIIDLVKVAYAPPAGASPRRP